MSFVIGTVKSILREKDNSVSRQLSVLVVDDEPSLLKMLDLALRQAGFSVLLAASGREAIELYRNHHRTISVVLLDVQMPMPDGVPTLAALQRINPHICCCFIQHSAIASSLFPDNYLDAESNADCEPVNTFLAL